LREWYGFAIGAAFSGVVGVGYPIINRVWCRFGCPMAAILGLQQRLLSKFRITTNGGQCISCGNCSTYCEMGIDVRSYAEKEKTLFVPPVWYLCGCLPRGIEMKMTHRQAESIRTKFY
jgi:polyferredoxin